MILKVIQNMPLNLRVIRVSDMPMCLIPERLLIDIITDTRKKKMIKKEKKRKKDILRLLKSLSVFSRGKIPVIRYLYRYLNNKNVKESLFEKNYEKNK